MSKPVPGLEAEPTALPPGTKIAINGGCWLKVEPTADECPDNGYTYQGGCYIPFLIHRREPTSAPQE